MLENITQNRFDFRYIWPKLKISLFPLTRPTLSKSADWKFYIGNLPSLFFSFRSKFVLLRIPYFRFVSPKDRYFRITEHIFVVKKKKPTYLPTSKIVGRVRGNRNIFNCGPKVSKRMSQYIGINHLLFICFAEDFLMHSLRKSISETCIMLLCNYYCFWHKKKRELKIWTFKIFIQFECSFWQIVHLYELLMGYTNILLFYLEKGSIKGGRNLAYLKGM